MNTDRGEPIQIGESQSAGTAQENVLPPLPERYQRELEQAGYPSAAGSQQQNRGPMESHFPMQNFLATQDPVTSRAKKLADIRLAHELGLVKDNLALLDLNRQHMYPEISLESNGEPMKFNSQATMDDEQMHLGDVTINNFGDRAIKPKDPEPQVVPVPTEKVVETPRKKSTFEKLAPIIGTGLGAAGLTAAALTLMNSNEPESADKPDVASVASFELLSPEEYEKAKAGGD